jgi:predicted AlkP superfamily phosphohydrolase/phosphomutase
VRLAVIGVDGGSWNVLKRLIDEGYMPNLKRLVKEGVHVPLRSTVPPVTGAAWLSLATGLSPGETGVLDFFKLSDGSLVAVSSRDYRGRAFWDLVGLEGYRVGVVD